MFIITNFGGLFMKKELFGRLPNGEEVFVYTLENRDASLSVMSYGAAILSFSVFGREIVGGFDSLLDYPSDSSYQGATVGRVANRISDAEFTMDGAIYMLRANDGENCLHGGIGFSKRNFKLEEVNEESVLFSYYSPDGEEGFPAGLMTRVRYTLSGTAVIIGYEAIPEGKTPISLTNHAYFNLDGFGSTIYNHRARIYAESYTEVGDDLIPTGKRPKVRGTVFDFTSPKEIGRDIGDSFSGYDHNFILSPEIFRDFSERRLGLGATVEGEELRLNVYTDRPGLQFYTGNFLGDGPDFRGGIPQIRHGAFCLEAQSEPNSIKRGECFFDEGEKYTHFCVYEIEKKQ